MSEETRNAGQDRIVNILKSLKPVRSSEDFELRLQRRITSPETQREPRRFRLSSPVPVFAYSLLLIVIAGSIWYFTYYHALTEPGSVIDDSGTVDPKTAVVPDQSQVPERDAVGNENKAVSGGTAIMPSETRSSVNNPVDSKSAKLLSGEKSDNLQIGKIKSDADKTEEPIRTPAPDPIPQSKSHFTVPSQLPDSVAPRDTSLYPDSLKKDTTGNKNSELNTANGSPIQ